MDTTQVSVTEYHERVAALLEHLELVKAVDWSKVDMVLWNAVETSEPEVVYSE